MATINQGFITLRLSASRRQLAACIALTAVALINPMSFGQSSAWPTIRHDNQRSGRSPIVASQMDVPRFTVNYLTCCGAAVPSAPIANADGTVYLNTADTLWAINGLTGQALWSVEEAGRKPSLMPPTGSKGEAIVTFNYMPSSSAEPAFVKVFEPDGTLRWQWNAPYPGAVFGVVIAPTGHIYGTYSGNVSLIPLIHAGFRFALDPDGNLLWHIGGTDINHSTAPMSLGKDGALFFFGEDADESEYDRLWRVDPADGSILWTAPQADNEFSHDCAPVLLDNGLVIFAVGVPYLSWTYHSFLKAYDQKTGEQVWQVAFNAPNDDPGGIWGTFQPVVLSDGSIVCFWEKIYIISPQGVLLDTTPYPDEFDDDSEPIAGGDDLIYNWVRSGVNGNDLIAFRPEDGKIQFRYEPAGSCITPSQPAILPDGSLFVAWRKKVYCENYSGTIQFVAFDPPPPSVEGDVTGDLTVNIDDLFAVIAQWGPCPAQPADCPADCDDDGDVDIDDLFIVIANWNS